MKNIHIKVTDALLFSKTTAKNFLMAKNRVKVVRTALSGDKAFELFKYLKEIADTIRLTKEESESILSKNYDSISEISKDCILSSFLNGVNRQQKLDFN